MGRCDYFEKECDNNGKCIECLNLKKKPDMREKVKEYIVELDEEISRCEKLYEDVSVNLSDPTKSLVIQCRIETLVQVKGDLEGRLNELI